MLTVNLADLYGTKKYEKLQNPSFNHHFNELTNPANYLTK